MKTRIFFVRHGEVTNPNNIFYGRLSGFPLSLNGKKQILKTARSLADTEIDAIYASPLLRAKQSAKIIADTLRLSVNYSDHFLEVHSSLQGKTFDYIASHYAKENIYASLENKVTGETLKQVFRRMQEFIAEIHEFHRGKNIIAVSHGDPIMIAKAHVEKLPIIIDSIRPDNGYIQKGEIYLAEFNSR